MQLHSNPFARDKDVFAPLLIKERMMMALFAATAVVGTFSPVIWAQQSNPVKLVEQLWGLFASGCFSTAAFTRKQKEQTYQAIGTANHAIVKEHLKGTFAYEQSRQQIEAKRQLAQYVNTLPIEERERWMHQYGLQGLVELPQVQQAVLEARRLPQLPTNPGVASVNEDVVQSIVNPGIMQVLQDLAARHPNYIRIDGEWLDELCDSSSLQNMSDRFNHHFLLAGGTQSGKSTLAGVIVNKIADNSQGPAIVIGSDPKDQVTQWLCKFSRKFDGMSELENWIKFATRVVDLQKEEIGKNNGTDGIPEIFFIQDEIDSCYGGGKGFPGKVGKDVATELQALWNYLAKFTAGLKCHGIFLSQSPLSSSTGFSRPNLKNICFLALGQMSSYILGHPSDFMNTKPEIIGLMKQVCELLDKDGARYALVVPTRGNPYVALIPTFDIAKTQPQRSNQDASNWYELLESWVKNLGRKPTASELKAVWTELTNQELNNKGLALLMEKLGFGE